MGRGSLVSDDTSRDSKYGQAWWGWERAGGLVSDDTSRDNKYEQAWRGWGWAGEVWCQMIQAGTVSMGKPRGGGDGHEKFSVR